MKNVIFSISTLVLFSCANESIEYKPLPINLEEEEAQILDAIAATQQLLIQHLTARVDSTNLEPAVRFCAENAQRLTDSISNELGYAIRRISPKNRNTRNEATKKDWEVFRHFEKSKESGTMDKSYFDELNQTYYTPIVLGMPLCLKCHGTVETRDAQAYVIIQEYYPRDKAVDYALGDLRGLWSVRKK